VIAFAVLTPINSMFNLKAISVINNLNKNMIDGYNFRIKIL
jgi:hypothetical protein